MKKTLLATALLVSFTASAGQLVIENGSGKIALSADSSNSLIINGNKVANAKMVYDAENQLVGELVNLSTQSTDSELYLSGGSVSGPEEEQLQTVPPTRLNKEISPLLTIKKQVNGTTYTVNTTPFASVPGSVMLYTDQACSQAAYVSARTVPSSVLFENTVVGDIYSGKAYSISSHLGADELDEIASKNLYGLIFSAEWKDGEPPFKCEPIVKSEDNDYGYLDPVPVKVLPDGIIEATDEGQMYDSDANLHYYSFDLYRAVFPLHIK